MTNGLVPIQGVLGLVYFKMLNMTTVANEKSYEVENKLQLNL